MRQRQLLVCALRRESAGKPDAGNLHVRFGEGEVGRTCTAYFSTLSQQKNLDVLNLSSLERLKLTLLFGQNPAHQGTSNRNAANHPESVMRDFGGEVGGKRG